MAALIRRVADHQLFIGQFCRKKELWHRALTRFLFVADNSADAQELQSSALAMAAEACNKLAEQLEKDPKSDALTHFRSSTPEQLKTKANQLLERSKALSGSGSTNEAEPKREG